MCFEFADFEQVNTSWVFASGETQNPQEKCSQSTKDIIICKFKDNNENTRTTSVIITLVFRPLTTR